MAFWRSQIDDNTLQRVARAGAYGLAAAEGKQGDKYRTVAVRYGSHLHLVVPPGKHGPEVERPRLTRERKRQAVTDRSFPLLQLETAASVVQLSEVPPRGAELSDDSPGNRPVSKAGGTVGDVDLQLVAVIQAWAELPESVKDAVMEMVRG